MSLSSEEMVDLIDDIVKEFPVKITEAVTRANRSGELATLLKLLCMEDLLQVSRIDSYKEGKIVVVGGSEVTEKVLLGIAKDLGLNKDRFEFCLDYETVKKYNFHKMQYAPQYRVIMFGPIPHSGEDKGSSSSIITEIENNGAYPRSERLISGGILKITKTNFREKLESLLDEGYIK